MKSADSLDVAATRRPQGKGCVSASRPRLHTQKIIKNDRCGIVRLSKIAHMRKLRLGCQDRTNRGELQRT